MSKGNFKSPYSTEPSTRASSPFSIALSHTDDESDPPPIPPQKSKRPTPAALKHQTAMAYGLHYALGDDADAKKRADKLLKSKIHPDKLRQTYQEDQSKLLRAFAAALNPGSGQIEELQLPEFVFGKRSDKFDVCSKTIANRHKRFNGPSGDLKHLATEIAYMSERGGLREADVVQLFQQQLYGPLRDAFISLQKKHPGK